MSSKRLTGIFEWYAVQKGYGVIRGEDGREYFAHHSNHPDVITPYKGMRVSFIPAPRPRGKQGMEARSIQQISGPPVRRSTTATSSQPSRSMASSPAPPPRMQEDLRKAAQEALRLQRERKQGRAPRRTEDLPPGTRVQHRIYGVGIVELAAPRTVSVRFENDPRVVRDLPRSEVRPVSIALETQELRISPSSSPVHTNRGGGSGIGSFMRNLCRDVQETLLEEGLEDNGIYLFHPPQEPSSAPQPLQIDPRVAEAFLKTSKIKKFYSHQVEARQALLAGKNVLIATPTASGKTESYNPTVLETLLNDPNATALYLFPLVALGFDQTERLQRLNQELPINDRLTIGIYNSSVDWEEKKQMLRRDNRILVTTPESLHYIFLPKPYPNWQRFFGNLRYVVLDEAHVYKGVLGANMANIVRRLLVRCRREGNPRFPQLIISSATVRQPQELAHQLTGLPANSFQVIDKSGAPGTGRHFLVSRSDIHELETLCADLLDVTTIDAREGTVRPIRTIVFLKSINGVKRSTQRVRHHLRRTGRGHLAASVDAYYSDKGDKADVLQRLRKGEVRCLFATTALMAGIDIGGLDVAIVKNFPGLIMDARQMFGRAGRAGEGAAIFLADRTDPFDQFYLERPKELFEGPTEEVIANPENPHLLAAHLQCAAQTSTAGYNNTEGPLSGRWVELFGETGRDLLDILVERGILHIRNGNYHLDEGDPHQQEPLNNIRSMESETYSLIEEGSNRLLEEKRRATAFRDAHPEAIIWCSGEKYRVLDLNRQTRQIKCRPEPEGNLHTRGVEKRRIEILEIDSPPPEGATAFLTAGVCLNSGQIKIITSVQNYLLYQTQTLIQCRNRRCRHETPNLETRRCPKCNGAVRVKQVEKLLEEKSIPLDPPLSTSLTTRACWIDLPHAVKQQFEREFWPRWTASDEKDENKPALVVPSFEYAVHSMEHALLKAFPERIRCDRDEIGGIYSLKEDSLAARLYLYDNFPGGLGQADRFADDPLPLLKGALSVLERCTCDDDEGCPVCLAHFGCHCFNTMLSKLAGRYLLRMLLDLDPARVIADLEEYARICIPSSKTVHNPLPQKQSSESDVEKRWFALDEIAGTADGWEPWEDMQDTLVWGPMDEVNGDWDEDIPF